MEKEEGMTLSDNICERCGKKYIFYHECKEEDIKQHQKQKELHTQD